MKYNDYPVFWKKHGEINTREVIEVITHKPQSIDMTPLILGQ